MACTVDAARVQEFQDEDEDLDQKVAQLAGLVSKSKYIVVFTGAGVSTSAGIKDYRGPSGCWTLRRVKELEALGGDASPEDLAELEELRAEAAKEVRKTAEGAQQVPKEFLQPGFSHLAIATLIRQKLAHYVVTTNLDGLFRKAGLQAHSELCCLHGDVFVERCTGCRAEFERNFRVRRPGRHVHDHHAGVCPRCGSAVPESWTGMPKGSTASLKTVVLKARPAREAISFARVEENARARWPGAELASVNGVAVAGEDDDTLLSVITSATMPLRLTFRILESGSSEAKTGGGTDFSENHLVGVEDENVGTKDTHINFGEALDPIDLADAEEHCRKSDLCIVMGTSMSLRHCTHYPFMAKKTVIVNLQRTPDDHRCYRGLRIWGTCDEVLRRLLGRLDVLDRVPRSPPPWRPRDPVALEEFEAQRVPRKYQALARHLEREAMRRSFPKVLSEEDLETFRRDGVLVLRGFFSADEVQRYLSFQKQWIARYAGEDGKDLGRVMDPFGGFLEMFYGEAKEFLWGHARFDEAWTDIFSVYAFGDTPGFEHSMGEFNPEEKYLFPDRACYRHPDQSEVKLHRRGRWEGQKGTGEHVDWDVYCNVFGKGAAEFGVWERGARGMERRRPLEAWRPVQCSVAFSDSAAGEGNFQCAPGWHLRMADFSRQMRENFGETDFRKGLVETIQVFKPRQAEGYGDEMVRDFVDVPVRAGDVIFWDARLPHANHQEHRGKVPRICDFNARLPGTALNREYARRSFTNLYSKSLHPPDYPARFASLEAGQLPVERLNALARRILAVPDGDE